MSFIDRYIDLRVVGAFALVFGLGSCNSTNTTITPPTSNNTFTQVERLGRPLIKEAFQNYDAHDSTNRANPYNDPTLPGAIVSFTTGVAGRSQQLANTLQAVLIPDEMQVDLTQSGAAAYLGVETGGATGGKFGGRALTDDVVGASLLAVFGPVLTDAPGGLGLVPDDKKESPCLSYQNVVATPNVSGNSQFTSLAQLAATKNETPSTFPYLGKPY
jgi:hypothetical protein